MHVLLDKSKRAWPPLSLSLSLSAWLSPSSLPTYPPTHTYQAMHVLFDKIKALARSMHLEDGRPRPAFPLQFIISVLVELETEVDASRGLQPFPAAEERRLPHRTWR